MVKQAWLRHTKQKALHSVAMWLSACASSNLVSRRFFLKMKRTGPTNPVLKELIEELRKKGSEENIKIWKRVASDLERPSRIRRVVNLLRINRYAKEDETVVVPGKVLGGGELNHKVVVAAYQFSESAIDKINKVGKAITIVDLMKENPKASKVRIIG